MEGCPSDIQSQNCHCNPLVSQLPTRVKDMFRPYPSIPKPQLQNRMVEGRPQGQPGPGLHLQLQDHSPRDENQAALAGCSRMAWLPQQQAGSCFDVLVDRELRMQLNTSSLPQMRHMDSMISFLLIVGVRLYFGGTDPLCFIGRM